MEGGGGASGERLEEGVGCGEASGSREPHSGSGLRVQEPGQKEGGVRGVSRGGRHPEGPRAVFCVLNTTKAPDGSLALPTPGCRLPWKCLRGLCAACSPRALPCTWGSIHGSSLWVSVSLASLLRPDLQNRLCLCPHPLLGLGRHFQGGVPLPSSTQKPSTPLSTLSLPCEQNNHLQLN